MRAAAGALLLLAGLGLAELVLERDDLRALTPPDQPLDPMPSQETRFLFESVPALPLQCSLDGAAFAPCASPFEFVAGDGLHIFRVTNGVETVEHAWTIDTTAPVALFAQTPHPVQPRDVVVSFSMVASEPSVFVCDFALFTSVNETVTLYDGGCNQDPGDPLVVSTAFSIPPAFLEENRYRLRISGCDEAGNCGDFDEFRFTVDNCVNSTCFFSGCDSTSGDLTQCSCDDGFFLDVSNAHLCRECRPIANCQTSNLHCTNGDDSICGACTSGFDAATRTNFNECEFVTFWG